MVYIARSPASVDSGWATQRNPERSGSVRTGLLIIMMMFFAGLALDIVVPAIVLLALVLADRAIYPLFYRRISERGAA
ncbi:hypothetical protein BC360_03715 [Ensifer sp. LC163]|nr:hypothetical protein BC360_03715 [Ensifer sp. LC163]